MNIVTLDQLLNITNAVTNSAEQNKDYNQLLDDHVCNQYNIIEKKKKLQCLFSDFKSARYLYEFPINNININSKYEAREGFIQKSTASQVENAIERYVDKQVLTTDIYNSIIKASYKLTNFEAIYFINTFFTHKSEESISELINVSKTYLQKIKKSCIVKLWVDLKEYCDKDD